MLYVYLYLSVMQVINREETVITKSTKCLYLFQHTKCLYLFQQSRLPLDFGSTAVIIMTISPLSLSLPYFLVLRWTRSTWLFIFSIFNNIWKSSREDKCVRNLFQNQWQQTCTPSTLLPEFSFHMHTYMSLW